MEPTLNPFAPPLTDSKGTGLDSSDVDGMRAPSKWVLWSFWVVPAIFGIGLVGTIDGRLGYLVLRSPVTITATTFIRENFHPRLFAFEQDLLAHLPLVPYFLFYALTLTLVLSPKLSPGLIMLPGAYAVVLAVQLLFSSIHFAQMGLRWYYIIPSAVYVFCYVPITQIGINVAGHIRTKGIAFLPRSAALASMFGVTTLCIAFAPVESIQSTLLLIVLCVLSYMMRQPIRAVTNHPIDLCTGDDV